MADVDDEKEHQAQGSLHGRKDAQTKSQSDVDGASQIRSRIDTELQSTGIRFTSAMRTRVMEAAHYRSSEYKPNQRTTTSSFWDREIRIPVSALMVPVLLIAVFGTIIFRNPNHFDAGRGGTSDTLQVVQLPSGVFSSDELEQKGKATSE